MWENLSIAMPLIIGTALIFLVFCAMLIIFEKRNKKKKAMSKRSKRTHQNIVTC